MKKSITIFFFLLFLLLSFSFGEITLAFAGVNHDQYLMGYVTPKITANKELQQKINLLNILAYAFLHVDKQGYVEINPYMKPIKSDGFEVFSTLQNKSGNLIKLASIGGANSGNDFYDALNQPSHFVNSVSSIINQYHLSGVDLDFEPNDLFTPEQAQAYANLIQTLREKLGNSTFISITAPSDFETLHSIGRSNWKKIIKNINFVSLMAYDFHTAFYSPHYTGYNSNLYADPNEPELSGYYHSSVDQSIKYLTFLGIPTEKIMLGFPSYGLSYGGVISEHHGLFQSFDPKLTPIFDAKGIGRLEYKTIPKLLNNGFQEYATYYNKHISGVWAYNSKTHQLIAYDNQKLIKEKAEYVKRNHLAGLMAWAINYDVPANSKYSLLDTAWNNLK